MLEEIKRISSLKKSWLQLLPIAVDYITATNRSFARLANFAKIKTSVETVFETGIEIKNLGVETLFVNGLNLYFGLSP